ncbi:MAG: hydroxylamine reductase [Phycisphaerae bacterium]
MFCFQCEQAARGTGCNAVGICGKTPDVAALQDLLIHATKGISMYAHRAGTLGQYNREIDHFVLKALFTTVTNVNFSPQRMRELLLEAAAVKDKARRLYEQACHKAAKQPQELNGPAIWTPAADIDGLILQGQEVGIMDRIGDRGMDVAGLEELLTYGLKGTATYADHAMILGYEDAGVYAFFHEALNSLTRTDHTTASLLPLVLKCGEVNLKVMEMLDKANTGTYGHPVPTPVRITPVKGKAILISGHDLKDLEELLKQTQGTGVNIYTHSEMLPAHGYPELKKYKHLVGNYGGAWFQQQDEFDRFPGAILMTTNCIQKPRDSYRHRLFTCGLVAWPGVTHITDRNFRPVIEAALAAEGFKHTEPEKTIMVGFGHDTVLGVADKVIEAVKTGRIRRFFLIGGCDGHKEGRNYYTEFAEAVPDDCMILTLACGKYRFNKLDFGTIDGLPRLLDVGQCNDAYSAIKIAMALAEAFECDVNDLPLSLILSWYEQKAVCILLTLLHLGVKNIRLGPSLPAFVSPNVLNVLVEKFGIRPIGTAEEDLAECLNVTPSRTMPIADPGVGKAAG